MFFIFVLAAGLCSCSPGITIDKSVLQDKIRGGWVGKLAGCTYGLPVEFRYNGRMIPDDVVIPWNEGRYTEDWRNGGNDDIYMNLTFIDVFERLGLDAPADSFALAFANAGYNLWHANLEGRYNILHSLMPPLSGHWKNNPHADDIDFQIEADYAGLMAPGMPLAAATFTDDIGHIMNYGDGWYGGVYVATMYSLAFIYDDVRTIVLEALKAIPQQSRYHRCISDVLSFYDSYPEDWKAAWTMIEDKYSRAAACPGSLSRAYNIDAVLNSAYVVIGLLYGGGDFDITMEISARCGQDADCNPATAAGILGTMLGYSAIPQKWTDGLSETEDREYAGTGRSLRDIYDLSYRHACKVIKKYGGKVSDKSVSIKVQTPEPVRYECSFPGLKQNGYGDVVKVMSKAEPVIRIEFYGCGIVIAGGTATEAESDFVAEIKVLVDGLAYPVQQLPVCERKRRDEVFFDFCLPEDHHVIELRYINPDDTHIVNVWNYYTFAKENAETEE